MNGPWSGGVGEDRSAGRAGDGLVIDDLFAVQDDSDVSVDQGEIVALPFTPFLAGIFRRGDASEDRADPLQALHAAVPIHDLRLVHAAKVDTAVALFLNQKLNVQPEVFVNGIGAKICVSAGGTEVGLWGRVNEESVFDAPAIDFILFVGTPTGEVPAIENRKGKPKAHLARSGGVDETGGIFFPVKGVSVTVPSIEVEMMTPSSLPLLMPRSTVLVSFCFLFCFSVKERRPFTSLILV